MELAIHVDRNRAEPLHQQLYQELRRSILDGRLGAGSRIPSSRILAKSLGVSRATVTLSYEQLLSEGYLQATIGSGTSVSRKLPEDLLLAPPISSLTHVSVKKRAGSKLSSYGESVTSFVPKPDEQRFPFDFRYCRPAVDHFPILQWRRLLVRHCRYGHHDILDYAANGKGYAPLREAIARYLRRSRAVNCTADQIVIVNGSQQALQIAAQVLVNRGDTVAVEEPGYLGAKHAFSTHGARLRSIPVDENGIQVNALPQRPVRLVYVTPSHQFPTGAVLSLPRRLALLAWAESAGALIIEDDYDSEYRYAGRPIPAMQGLDRSGVVIFSGSFSDVLFPALRLGYVVIPPDLVDAFAAAESSSTHHPPPLEQAILSDFINEGHFARHIRRMRELYAARLAAFLQAAQSRLAGLLEIPPVEAGLQTVGWLQGKLTAEQAAAAARKHDVEVVPLSRYSRARKTKGLLLGFAAVDVPELQSGVDRLAPALEQAD